MTSALPGFTPMHDVILVDPLDYQPSTSIIIPRSYDLKESDAVRSGIVAAVGPGFRDKRGRLHPLDVQVGDKVLFGAWIGAEAQVNGPLGKKLLAMREKDLLGIEG